MSKVDRDDSIEKTNDARSNNRTMKEMMNLLAENNQNMAGMEGMMGMWKGNSEMNKEQLMESFLLFQQFMSLNMAVNKGSQSKGNANVNVKVEEEGKGGDGNDAKGNQINEIEYHEYKENEPYKVNNNQEEDKKSNHGHSNKSNDDELNKLNQYEQEAVNNNVEDNTIEANPIAHTNDIAKDKDNDNSFKQAIEDQQQQQEQQHQDMIDNDNVDSNVNANEIDPIDSNYLSEPKKPNIPVASTIQNQYDEIPIKPSSNFMELLEKNLQNNEQFQAPIEPKKKIIKKPPTVQKKQIVISKPTKEEIKKYTYYSDNFNDEEKEVEEKEKKKKKKIKDQKVQLEQQIQQKQIMLEKQSIKKEQVPIQDKKGVKPKPVAHKDKDREKEKDRDVNQVVKGENAIKNLKKGYTKPKPNWKEAKFEEKEQEDAKEDKDNLSFKDQSDKRLGQQQQSQPPSSNPLSYLSFGGVKSNFVVGFSCQTNTNTNEVPSSSQPIINANTNPNIKPNTSNTNTTPNSITNSNSKTPPYQKRSINAKPLINQPPSIISNPINKDQCNNNNNNNDIEHDKERDSSKSNKPLKSKKSPIKSQEPSLIYDYTQNLKCQSQPQLVQSQAQDQFEDISNLIIEPNTNTNTNINNNLEYNAKMQELNAEIYKMKAENTRVSQLREKYEKLNQKLQKDYKDFNIKREQDYSAFEAFKQEETKQLGKERKQLTQEQKALTDTKVKMQTSNTTTSKKDRDLIEQIKAQLTKTQEDYKLKDNTNKLMIERLKKQLDEANSKISELSQQITKTRHSNQTPVHNQSYNNTQVQCQYQYQNKDTNSNPPSSNASRVSKSKSKQLFECNQLNINEQQYQVQPNSKGSSQLQGQGQVQSQKAQSISSYSNVNLIPNQDNNKDNKSISHNDNDNYNDDNNEEEEGNYDMVFPNKYHNDQYTLLKQETASDGKVIRLYDKDKKEILFPSGVRKEMFNDGYQIVYFNNGDIKQMYPNNGKSVYYFSEAKTIQTTFTDKQVFKFENGQIEQHYKDGTKRIAFPDGSLRYILPDGSEETYYLDGKIQKIDVNGVMTIEHEDGANEVKYSN